MTNRVLSGFALSLATTLAASAIPAATLTTGTGDGSLTVNVTAFGSILRPASDGLPDDGLFDPIGGMGAATTIYESFIAVPAGPVRESLETLASDLVEVLQTETEYVTRFRVGSFDQYSITLSQSLFEWLESGQRAFPGLTQQFEITNFGETADSFDIIRFLDVDLNFGGEALDFGGRNTAGSTLYQIGASNDATASLPYIELSSSLQGLTNAVPDRNFQVARASDLHDLVLSGENLDNTVEGDENNNNVTDTAFDVALAYQNFVTIEAGQTVTYTTTTYFANTTAPGSDESVGLLPDRISPDGGFDFELDPSLFTEGLTVWIDPVIAVGYTYEVTGAEFASVTAPSLGLVNDPDGYTVRVDGNEFALLPGATLIFDDGVTIFEILGISEALALDPTNPTAFATGVSLRAIFSQTILITQTPKTEDVSPVPLPAGGVLLGVGLLGLLAVRRRRV